MAEESGVAQAGELIGDGHPLQSGVGMINLTNFGKCSGQIGQETLYRRAIDRTIDVCR